MIIIFNKKTAIFLIYASFLLILILLSRTSQGQDFDYTFLKYLNDSRQYSTLLDYSKYLQDEKHISNDTLFFFEGKSYYAEKNHKNAFESLSKVKSSSVYYSESVFLAFINAIYNESYQKGASMLDSFVPKDTVLSDFKYYQLAALSLLKREISSYEAYKENITSNYYFTEKEQRSLDQIAVDLKEQRNKSVWLAGLYSAILPGAGKFYAGKRGQGIYTFIISSFLALQTWESYHKSGVESPRFIIYGSLFSLFHVANIWSSSLAVKRYNNELNEAINYRIRMDMHIPIRALFK